MTMRHGDVYARPTGSDQPNKILRKPPEKLLAMRQLVYDTNHQSKVLIDAEYPSRWQPWKENATVPPHDSWKIERSEDGLVPRSSQPSRNGSSGFDTTIAGPMTANGERPSRVDRWPMSIPTAAERSPTSMPTIPISWSRQLRVRTRPSMSAEAGWSGSSTAATPKVSSLPVRIGCWP